MEESGGAIFKKVHLGMRISLLAFLLLAGLRLAKVWDGPGALEALPGLCVFHRLTGWDCPGCGMTRSWICLLKGDWQQAWAWHPFGIPLALAFVAACLMPASMLLRLKQSRAWAWACAGALALLLGWWVWVKVWPRI